MAPNPPFRSVIEELLFEILQKLPEATYLTSESIDSLAKLNALILDADITSGQSVIDEIKGNVPAVADTLEKIYGIIQALNSLKAEDIDTLAELNAIITDADLLRGGDIKFPNVYFISPEGDNTHGLKGDLSRPFLPDGIASRAVAGDAVRFLPGDYVINSNIAVNGVDYGTLGGAVKISMTQANAILFDYSAIPDSSLPIKIAGDFEFVSAVVSGGVFKFNRVGQSERSYLIRWIHGEQHGGIFLQMPTVLSDGFFAGALRIMPSATTAGIRCDLDGCSGMGVVKMQILNNSTVAHAIDPFFNGFSFEIDYRSNHQGLFNQPFGNQHLNNKFHLNIIQPAGATSYISSADCDVTVEGGHLIFMGDSKIAVKGVLKNCMVTAGPRTDIVASIIADDVHIVNDQVALLILDGVWRNCVYSRTSVSPVVLNGYFYDLTFSDTCSLMTINGYVELADNVMITLGGGEYLEVRGKLLGNAAAVIQIWQTSTVVISGEVKNRNANSPAIKTAVSGNPLRLVLKGAILEAGSSASLTVDVLAGDTLSLRLYGNSFANKPFGGGGVTNVLLGSLGSDYVIDPGVEVYHI